MIHALIRILICLFVRAIGEEAVLDLRCAKNLDE